MSSVKCNAKKRQGDLEPNGGNNQRFLDQRPIVVCPKCGELGKLYYSPKIKWYVKHGKRRTHYINSSESLEFQLHDPRLAIIWYMGGDGNLLTHLSKMIPPHWCYVEVFGGGAPLLLNKSPSPVEIYNDVDGDLVNLFRVVRENLDEFLRRTEWLLVSRQQYYEFLHNYRDIKDPVDRAVAYWYIIRLSFMGKFGGGFSTSTKNNHAKSFWNTVEKLRLIHERLKNVVIEQLDFREVLKKYDSKETFFYLDPPHLYASTEKGKDYYREKFTDNDYMELLRILEGIRGKWLLKQVGAVPWIKDWAKKHGYHVKRLAVKMSCRPNPRDEVNPQYKLYFIANYVLP